MATTPSSTSVLRSRLDKLTDRQYRLLLHYMVGRYKGNCQFEQWLEDGVRWLEGGQSDGR
jgi:hypothetical protein